VEAWWKPLPAKAELQPRLGPLTIARNYLQCVTNAEGGAM
jgi:hypothetical protein